MIAHRLQTILTAENLVYLKSPSEVETAKKDSQEYTDIIQLLRKTNYAHQTESLSPTKIPKDDEEEKE